MNAFADYTFYVTTFGGSSIPQASFSALSLRASYEVERHTLERASAALAGTDTALIEKIKMATCAAADALYLNASAASGPSNVASERVGDYSVNYANADVLSAYESKAVAAAIERYLGLSGLLFRGVA